MMMPMIFLYRDFSGRLRFYLFLMSHVILQHFQIVCNFLIGYLARKVFFTHGLL